MKKLEFSKLVVIFISLVWVASFVAVFFKPEFAFVLDYTNGAFMSGVIGYLLKSGVENYGKVTSWGNPNEQTIIEHDPE